jgi:serine/threonine-protein kinase
VLYEATSGTPPFLDLDHPAHGPRDLGHRAPPRLRSLAADTPPFFDDVVMTLLAPDPEDRPRDGFEVADLLRRVLDDELLPSGAPRSSERPFSSIRPPAPLPEGALPLGPSVERPAGPRLAAVPLDRLGPLCARALIRVEARARAARLSGPTWATLEEARKLAAMVEAIGELVVADSRAIEASQAKGRASRADLGRRLDELARERSKTLGWAGTIAERAYTVQAQRFSGEHPIPAIDAMIWEQAALEQEEDRVREKAAELAAKMAELQLELDRHNEQVERELLVATAGLEGRAAALRSLAVEAWLLLERTARQLGLGESALVGDEAPATEPSPPPTIEDPPTLEAARDEPISTLRASPLEAELAPGGSASAPPRRGR